VDNRARRAVIGVAALLALVVAVLVVANWGTVRDHVEAWHFQLTRQTETIEPKKGIRLGIVPDGGELLHTERYLKVLSTYSSLNVIFDPAECTPDASLWIVPRVSSPYTGPKRQPVDWVLLVLRENGWRVIEQRLPRRGYIVIKVGEPIVTLPAHPPGMSYR